VKAESERKSTGSAITDADLYNSLVVYPIPAKAIDRAGPREGPSLYGISCELTLGNDVFLTSEKSPRMLLSDNASNPYVVVNPGDFVVLTTHEVVYLPRGVVAFISIRNSYKQTGLINVSGFHVDPGFRGKLVFTAFNAGPREVVLKHRERMFMIAFAKVCGDADPYWQMQMGISMDTISRLHGISVSPRSLDKRLSKLETVIKLILGPIVVALIGALVKLLIG
jgi:dCTP deaminase